MADANLPASAGTLKSSGNVTGHVRLAKRKRGDQWYLKYRPPSGRQVQKLLGPAWTERSRPPAGYYTKRTAEEALAALLTDLRRGTAPDRGATSGRTFADAVAAWLHYVQHEKDRKASTVRGYRLVGRLLTEEFGAETPIEAIDTERIDTYRRRLLTEGKVTRRTIQQRLVLLHGLLGRAVANGWIRENPAGRVERVNVQRSAEFNVLSVEQVEAIARKADSTFGAAIVVAAFTGLRTGELRALRWRDVDFVGSTIRVVRNMPTGGKEGTPKSGVIRSVPLIDKAARVLDGLSRREHFTGADDRVFANEVGGMVAEDCFRDALYAAMLEAGIDRKAFPAKGGFVFHDLRHSFGTLAAELGFSLVEIQAWMGHAHIATTMIYAHYVPKHDAARRFSEGVESAAAARSAESVSRDVSRTPPLRA